MTFHSILFQSTDDRIKDEALEAPIFFEDLNLDQIINAITASRQEYNLKPFFYTPLRDADTIQYRHEVMQDIENEALMEHITLIARKMVIVRRYLALSDKAYFKRFQEAWFLEAAKVYCEAVTGLAHDLNHTSLKSRGLLSFRAYLTSYAQSDSFLSLLAEAEEIKTALSTVQYCVTIKEDTVRVRKYEAEPDYSIEVVHTFEKFKQGAVRDYEFHINEVAGMGHVEARILDCIAKLYPDIFTNLGRFCVHHSHFLDETISRFDREIQFYTAYLEHIDKLKRAGLRFCYPQVSGTNKEVYNYDGFDLALANLLAAANSPIVCNDFHLKDNERIIVVSGPNQGGKTTFARTFGQLHYLASLGCPVPGRKAQLFLFDQIFTHFENEENIKNLRGKLQDDLVRIYDILNQATPNSIIIMNEIFTATTLKDAVFLSKNIMGTIIQLDLLCVWVTFIDELASLSEETISMVSTVVPENPALRTFKIVRKPADGLAYALSIAKKYSLTYDSLKERIQS